MKQERKILFSLRGIAMAKPLLKLSFDELLIKRITGFQGCPLMLWHFNACFFLFFPPGFFSFFASQQKKKRNEVKTYQIEEMGIILKI